MPDQTKPSSATNIRRARKGAKATWRPPAVREIIVPDITASNPQVGGDGLGFGSTNS